MFRHQGKTRTLKHNLQIASLLSFVAGLVNVAGFLAIQKLTTNVTGHFAFFVDEVFQLHFWNGFVYFLYIFFFLLGAFFSNFLLEIKVHNHKAGIYTFPVLTEIVLLTIVATFGNYWTTDSPNIVAYALLFAMGLQNALVTKISNATVRTTHLTGLFTDLGIELSQLFFYKLPAQKVQLLSSIRLRLTIISFFFVGGIVGGLFYTSLHLKVLLIAAVTLGIGLIYDALKVRLLELHRKLHQH